VLAAAVLVVAEYLDHPAMAYAAMAAFFDHAFQFLAKSLKLLQPQFDLFEMRTGDDVGG